MKKKKVAIIMGSKSDLPTMQVAADILNQFNIDHQVKIISAHRTPQLMYDFAISAKDNGFDLIIAGAGGAAHLPGMVAAITTLPVIGVPVQSRALNGMDSLLSIVQMPGGVPVATMAIGEAGAKNAALFCVRLLALTDATLAIQLDKYIQEQALMALATDEPSTAQSPQTKSQEN